MKDWGDWGGISDAQAIAQRRYDKAHTTGFYMKLNTRTDLDIIKWLHAQKSKQGAIKQLIRQEIERQKRKGTGNSPGTDQNEITPAGISKTTKIE